VILAGTNSKPTGVFGLTTYHLEKVTLPETVVLLDGSKVDAIYKFVVRGERLDYCTCVVWVEGVPYEAIPRGKDEVVVTLLGKPKFQQHGTIRLTNGHGTCRIGREATLPERLEVPPEFQAPPLDPTKVTARTIDSALQFNGGPGVEIRAVVDSPQPILNATPLIQIGDEEFPAAATGREVIARIPLEKYWSLPETATLVVKYGGCMPGGIAAFLFNRSAVR